MPLLKRYDLASNVATAMKWRIIRLNLQDQEWKTRSELLNKLADRVMETRPGLDRTRVIQMIEAFWLSEN